MTADLDLTKPGPAGMWFDPSVLSPVGLAQDKAARDALETFCDACGVIGASYGYGNFTRYGKPVGRSFTACSDPDCRAVCCRASNDPRVADVLMARKGRAA